jgi:UDP-2,3-diacylglucosamine pyrophosphatase LpxH
MEQTAKRTIDVLVLSDIHLGTYGCHAKELLQYLHTIEPKMVILNGDIIDIWQFSKRYWPIEHMLVVRYFTDLMAKCIPVFYIPGNHDEMLRKFKDFQLGAFKICNKLSLKLNDKKIWIFHGDVFDVVMQHSKWLAKLGAIGYDTLILINRFINFFSLKWSGKKISLSKRVKNSVKGAVTFINKFESTVCEIAASNHYQYVICGHIHEPCIKTMVTNKGTVIYMNAGDWVENLTSLELSGHEWKLYRYSEDTVAQATNLNQQDRQLENNKIIFENFLAEMKMQSNNHHSQP